MNPHEGFPSQDFKSRASADSATRPFGVILSRGLGPANRGPLKADPLDPADPTDQSDQSDQSDQITPAKSQALPGLPVFTCPVIHCSYGMAA